MTETAELLGSYLYVPGLDHDKLIKAWTRGADAIVIDLEDSAPPESETGGTVQCQDIAGDRRSHVVNRSLGAHELRR